jgi:2-C-methyl-D-erythritol 2,4-cyclodiphosphate synthase
MKDYYSILGVSFDAEEAKIKEMYRKLAKKYHPDVAPEKKRKEMELKFKELQEAYSVLIDPIERTLYDAKYKSQYKPKIEEKEEIIKKTKPIYTPPKEEVVELPSLRIGFGYDVHKLVPYRKLIIGGVEIPYTYGLLGHSDADVLIHAICDALLGAVGDRDIGFHFPDSAPEYKNISSLILLKRVDELVKSHGYKVNNIDGVIVAEKPTMSPYIPKMREIISENLGLYNEVVSVKATTSSGLGFIGTREGIAAYAMAVVIKI